LSYENDSYFEPGNKPRIGHALIVINPEALAGADVYFSRIEDMVGQMLGDAGVRLPGARRHLAVAKVQAEGISLADALHQELLKLAGRSRKK
jgi:(2R)-3-sulfolactate dehydrogenase (NADP+)